MNKILFLLVVLFTAGCASTGSVDDLKVRVDDLTTQMQAQEKATSRALERSEAATSAALKAQADSFDTATKLDRMFEKSQLK